MSKITHMQKTELSELMYNLPVHVVMVFNC